MAVIQGIGPNGQPQSVLVDNDGNLQIVEADDTENEDGTTQHELLYLILLELRTLNANFGN